MWIVQCDCDPNGERLKSYPGYLLSSGKQASCGCASRNGDIVRSKEARDKAKHQRDRRYGSDLKFTLHARTKALVRQTLKNRNAYKTKSPLKNLNYSIEDLERHLLTTMPEGYSWQDFLDGALHIDHRRPIALFDFERDTDPGFKEAWSLDNLQLLTAAHNRAKRDRLDWISHAET